MSTSGYYEWLRAIPSQQALSTQRLDQRITEVYVAHRGRYGSPRITAELQAEGIEVSKNRVAKRMKVLQLKALAKRKWKSTTDSQHTLPVAENLLNRDFSTTGPNQKWVTDITYIGTSEGWVYLATVMDLYSRAIIGWSLQDRLETPIICEALQKALWRRKFPQGVLVHSDRGSQYCSKVYQELLRKNQLICSMSRTGECWDNAAMESFYHSLKTELVEINMGFKTRAEAKRQIADYIERYYNAIRRHSALAYKAPLVFELIG